MGLCICKEIVERSGGIIDVFSKGENQGATFIFTIKMNQVESEVSIRGPDRDDDVENRSAHLLIQ